MSICVKFSIIYGGYCTESVNGHITHNYYIVKTCLLKWRFIFLLLKENGSWEYHLEKTYYVHNSTLHSISKLLTICWCYDPDV
jgi:hypothetical protein